MGVPRPVLPGASSTYRVMVGRSTSVTGPFVEVYHYYANNGASLLGINRIGYDTTGWPFFY